KQKRHRLKEKEQAVLDAAFRDNPMPTKAIKLRLAHQLGIGPRYIQIWFQNKRQSAKKKAEA
ncbi:hypothetical protein BJ085DRAFT_1471, partial [Dimargaris cristalligena]